MNEYLVTIGITKTDGKGNPAESLKEKTVWVTADDIPEALRVAANIVGGFHREEED